MIPEDCGPPPKPPIPLQPLDCEERNTCPATPPICSDLAPASLDDDQRPRIIHVQTRGGGPSCKPLVINGCNWPMWRDVDAEGKPTCRPAVDCPGGTTWSEIDPKKCVPLPRWTGEGRWRETPTKPLWEHVCAALGNIPWVGNNAAKLCEQ
jgi:hypothetical protein